MLQLLQELRYYNHEDVRERLRQLHQFVVRELVAAGHEYRRTGKQRFRDDLIVCGLEGGGSGASHLVKPYRDENGIYAAPGSGRRGGTEDARGCRRPSSRRRRPRGFHRHRFHSPGRRQGAAQDVDG